MNQQLDTDDALCSITIIHEDILNTVRSELSDEVHLKKTAETFKVLSDPTRLTIINALLISEMCVCDIAALLNMTQPAVSHHLKVLRNRELVKYRRDGKIVYYALVDEHIGNIFRQGIQHAADEQ